MRGGWSGFGTATVGIDPNTFEVLNGHPNKIPTDKILGGVVQNCLRMEIPGVVRMRMRIPGVVRMRMN